MSHQNALIIIAPVKPGEIPELFAYLKKIKLELEASKHEEFENLGTIHYCRWLVIDHPDRTEGTASEGQTEAKLIFTSNFDGDTQEHIKELCEKATSVIDKIYHCCEGYPSLEHRNLKSRQAFLLQHSIKTTAFYRGSKDRSLAQIRDEEKLRNYVKGLIENGDWNGKSAKEITQYLRKTIKDNPDFKGLNKYGTIPKINWPAMILVGIGLLLLSPFILILILFIHFFYERNDENFTLKRSQLNTEHLAVLDEYEDLTNQNQFSQLVEMKEGKLRLFVIKAMFAFANVLIRFIFVEGKLMGIPTIHFARWVMFDDDKRVLFFSNFDGSWQQYLGDFIDKSGWGLTGIFSNTKNFPKTNFLLTGGAYDEEHFLAWSRYTQIPTAIWYDAYPQLSIKNVNTNSKIRQLLMKNVSEKKAKLLLKLI